MTKRFDFKTIENFDNHINGSIRGYDLLHDLITNISGFFLNNRRRAIDYGCTSGRLIHKISDIYGVEGIGYDITSKNFISGKAKLIEADITKALFSIEKADIYYFVFTLQFLQDHERFEMLTKIKESMDRSSVVIVCEKEIAENGYIQEAFTFSNYDYKASQFTAEEILQKEKLLRSTMSCMTGEKNKKMFTDIGYRHDIFFKSLHFTGYILYT